MQKRKGLLLISVLSLSLVACSKGSEETNILGFLDQPVYGNLKFTENISTNMGVIPLESGDGVLYLAENLKDDEEDEDKNEKIAKVYDCDLGVSTELCAQEGCSHSDKSCPAWREDALRFALYKYKGYILNQKTGNKDISFESVDFSTGKSETLYQLSCPENKYYMPGEVLFSYGKAFFTCQIITEGDVINTEQWMLVKIDLEKKEVEELPFDGCIDLYSLGGTEKAFYTLSATLNTDELLSYDEFYQQYPDGEEDYEGDRYRDYYYTYYLTPSKMNYEIRKYDIESGNYEVVCNDNVIQSGLGKVVSGNKFAYVTLNHDTGDSAIYLYDMDTDTAECLVEDDWIVEYSYADDKVFYNKNLIGEGKADDYEFYYVDTLSKDVTQLENNGSDARVYTACAETNNQLLSLTITREILNKEDYYKEDYSKKSLVW